MLLHAVKISGFRSFRKPVEVFVSPRTTILIGPNDHGKTNLLLAVDKLNPSNEFLLKEVNNHVREEDTYIAFQLRLNDADISSIETGIKPLMEEEALSERARFARESSATEGGAEGTSALRTLSGLIPDAPLSDWWHGIKKARALATTP
jgi:recombinational DNA repair ATPase RecF